jgi:hypothetical protein
MTELEQEDRQRVLDIMALENGIFVFGSNLMGIHGAGAAKDAADLYAAEFGIGEGPTGRSYAIPTKDDPYSGPRDLKAIRVSVNEFIRYAWLHPELTFALTRVGCGLAGIPEHKMEMLFSGSPENVSLPLGWRRNFIIMRHNEVKGPTE